MDFKITAFEDFGDWKTATTLCASTNQGPCFDYSVSQKSGNVSSAISYVKGYAVKKNVTLVIDIFHA